MPYIRTTTDGTRLHFVDYGPATGPCVLFVNSAYFGTEMWEYQMLPLAAEGYRCVGLDRRGHGRSDDVWGGFDLDTLADDIGALVDHLDLTGILLVGHSFGAAEAVRYVTRHGGSNGRVSRIALVAGMTPGPVRSTDHPDGIDPALVAAGNDAFRRDRMAFFNDGVEGFFALQFPENQVSPGYARFMVDSCAKSTAHAGNAVNGMIATLNVAPELAKIDIPALVVHGTDDVSAPIDLTGRRAASLIPGADLKEYAHAGHGLMTTHADQLNADLREFMNA